MLRRRIIPFVSRLGIRPRLSLVVLVAIAPLFALLLSGTIADRRLAIQAAIQRAQDKAKLGAAWQEDGFQHARDVLNVLRRMPLPTIADPAQCHRMLQDIAVGYPQFTSIGFVEASGLVHCLSLPSEPMQFRDRDVLSTTMAADPGAAVIGKFMIGPLTGKPIVVIAEPLPSVGAGEIRTGIAFVSLDLDWAAHHSVEDADTLGGSTFLVDTRDSKVLARSPDRAHSAGRPLQVPALDHAMRENPDGGTVEADDIDGTPNLFGFAPLDSAEGLMIAVGVPRDRVLAAANRRLIFGLGGAILVAVLAAAMAWLFAHVTQVKAIRSLVATAGRLGAGDLAATAEMEAWQAPEFRALSMTLRRMAVSIEATQADLKEREQQLRLLADYSTDMIIRVQEGGKRLFVSPACRKLTGWEPADMLRFSSQDTIHPDDIHFVSDSRLFDPAPFVFTYRMRHKDGRYIWVEGAARGLPTEAAEPRECIIVVRDVERRVEAERQVKESEARYRMLEEQGTDMIFQLDREMVRRYVSPACQEILGYHPSELVGTKPVGMVHPDDAERVAEVFRAVLNGDLERTAVVNRIRHRDGHWIWVEAQLRASMTGLDGSPVGITGSLRDISIRKAAEEQLEEANRRLAALARIDGLTGLANRRTFDEMLAHAQHQAETGKSVFSVIMIDVDRFKLFNDFYGHVSGDDCLRQVSRALESVLYHPGDIAARYGGEEFVVLLPGTDEAGATKVAERIRLAVLDRRIEHKGNSTAIVTISAGIASVSSESIAAGLEDGILRADKALYAAKDSGRNQVIAASILIGGDRKSFAA